jgi:hypothetical protein
MAMPLLVKPVGLLTWIRCSVPAGVNPAGFNPATANESFTVGAGRSFYRPSIRDALLKVCIQKNGGDPTIMMSTQRLFDASLSISFPQKLCVYNHF